MEELISIEQFLLSVPDDLQIWLRERKPESLHQAATLADDYMLARKADKRFSSSRLAPPLVSPGNCLRQQEEVTITNQGQPQRDS